MTMPSEKRQAPFKGASAWAEYEAAVKAACKEAANNITQNGVSFHSAGKYVVSSLAERGISLGRTQAIKRVKEVVAAGGQSPKIPVPFTRNALWKLREANEVDKNRRSMGASNRPSDVSGGAGSTSVSSILLGSSGQQSTAHSSDS